jgi:hypothetical protein
MRKATEILDADRAIVLVDRGKGELWARWRRAWARPRSASPDQGIASRAWPTGETLNIATPTSTSSTADRQKTGLPAHHPAGAVATGGRVVGVTRVINKRRNSVHQQRRAC